MWEKFKEWFNGQGYQPVEMTITDKEMRDGQITEQDIEGSELTEKEMEQIIKETGSDDPFGINNDPETETDPVMDWWGIDDPNVEPPEMEL